ncbi:MAG TPA: hemerythrin domain-containing protein [Acidimicrobiales bacterium]|nr:hemerythrin domain-containing protein [Acidimicrobiales bacterium]
MGETATEVLTREHEELDGLFARVRDEHGDRPAAWRQAVRQMATHVAIERAYLYPVVKRRHLGSPGLAEELRRDYARMEHLLVLTERRKVNSPDMPGLVTELLDVFEGHVQRCATALIPALRDRIDPAELENLGAGMRAAEKVTVSHPHPHLLALGPVYPWTTRVASRWDRVRDRTVRNR